MPEIKSSILNTCCLIALLFISCTDKKSEEIKINKTMPEKGICAHRGAMDTHPENSLPAFQEAIRLGAHMIEFDVQLTKDRHLVILHDPSVDRTTDGKGLVDNLTLQEVRNLDCGSWKSEEFNHLQIPTLKEVLLIMPKNIWLNIHLKGGEELGRKTALAIMEAGREHQSVVACGEESALGVKSVSNLIKLCNMERGSDRENYILETINNKQEFIQLLKSRDSQDLEKEIKLLKKYKIKINHYGSSSKIELKKLFQSGIDFILVNELSTMLDVADSLGIEPMNQ